jgi:hypothetical protein
VTWGQKRGGGNKINEKGISVISRNRGRTVLGIRANNKDARHEGGEKLLQQLDQLQVRERKRNHRPLLRHDKTNENLQVSKKPVLQEEFMPRIRTIPQNSNLSRPFPLFALRTARAVKRANVYQQPHSLCKHDPAPRLAAVKAKSNPGKNASRLLPDRDGYGIVRGKG